MSWITAFMVRPLRANVVATVKVTASITAPPPIFSKPDTNSVKNGTFSVKQYSPWYVQPKSNLSTSCVWALATKRWQQSVGNKALALTSQNTH